MSSKRNAKRWLPPALVEHLRPLLRHGIYFSGRYPDWSSASDHASGYDSAQILERVAQAMRKVVAGEAAFERDSVLFDEVEHSFPVLAGLLRAAAEDGERLSVLDFGGALGSSYYQYRDFLAVLPSLQWAVVEQPHFVRYGQERFRTNQLDFFYKVGECLEKTEPNVALLSSVLQYVEKPDEILTELTESGIRYLLIDRTPFADIADDMITIQHVPASIYRASYPCRIFARKRFLEGLGRRYEVVAQFDSADGSAVSEGVAFTFGGMILRKK